MKLAIVALIALSAQLSSAACLGEGQISAGVKSVTKTVMGECSVRVDVNELMVYSDNQTCPLDIDVVLSSDIKVATLANGQCAVDEITKKDGSKIQGIRGALVKQADESIVLEP